jgi:hypothetical protein
MVSTVPERIAAEGAVTIQVQVVLYGPGRRVPRLALGLQHLVAGIRNLSVVFWDNSPMPRPGASNGRPLDWSIDSSKEGNLGFGRAHNQLAQAAPPGCEYLFLLNPDAVPQYDCLEKLLTVADANPDAALIEAAQFPKEHPKGYDAASLDTNWCSAACVLVRRRAFDELGGFDPQFFLYCEDVDLSWRVWLAGWRCLYVPDARCLHVTEGEDLGKDRSAEVYYSHLSQLYLRSKHFGSDAVNDYLGAMAQNLSPRFVERVQREFSTLPVPSGPRRQDPHLVLTHGEAYGPTRW